MDEEVKQRLIQVYEQHISNLQARLKKLYTINNPLYENNISGGEIIDVRQEYEVCRQLEEIYTAVEQAGMPEGETYQNYSSYLFHASKAKEIFASKMHELEKQHTAEITNINALIAIFQRKLAEIK